MASRRPDLRTLQIRPARPEDRKFILALAERPAESGMPPWRDAAAMRAFHQHYAGANANAGGFHERVQIAESGRGAPLGFVHVNEIADGLTGVPEGYVSTLAVSSTAEGQGVGRALMVAAEDWARDRGYRLLTLETFAANDRARAFYRRLGYVEETLKLVKEL